MSTFPLSSQFTFSFAQPSAPPSRIPEHLKTLTDIWDIVFRFLQDDPPTLKACALVKSLWTTSIYKHLHRKLVISRRLRRTVRPEDVSGAALIEALASSRILAYVKELGLEFKRLSSDSPAVPWWADQLHKLHFEPLHAVHLIRADWDYEYMCFNKINLVEFLGNHPVKTLKLSECIITSTFSLRRFCRYNINTITELVLDQIEHGSEPPMRMKRRYEEPTLCKLKSLKVHSVRHGWYVEELLLLDLDLSHLTTLHATTTSFSHPVPVNFLKNFEETVRHLKIIVTPEMADSSKSRYHKHCAHGKLL
ncbi:hypothetical protein ONZ45_g5954 [Pleurotus djamor]|nr:hypothetical protein ONZ45_g5954 [Pleurotus djamor]